MLLGQGEKMKLLTFAVPSYNSEDYLARCLNTLLAGGDKVEIIVVNDGSTDRTGEIADAYQRTFPNIIKVVHQENQGHGGGVNAGLLNASGKYFKVVDSDDWLDTDALPRVTRQLEQWEIEGYDTDMMVCNYVYDHLNKGEQQVMSYRNVFPTEEFCGWDKTKRFNPSQYLIMHSLIFRTHILRESGVELPRHMFYVDNLFAYHPLPYVKNIFYLDVDLYHYFIGRDDQSVNEQVMMRRIDQQIAVTKIVAGCADFRSVADPKLKSYMVRHVSIMLAISSIHLLLIGTDEAMEKRKEMWRYIKSINTNLYAKLRYQTVGGLTYLPGKLGGKITVAGYRTAKKIYKFQ
jgi:glycosyltransferase involved in cell wall biosynthesis